MKMRKSVSVIKSQSIWSAYLTIHLFWINVVSDGEKNWTVNSWDMFSHLNLKI